MKSLTFALLLTAQIAFSQNAVWVDLSGDWRRSADDNPIYAQPGFDDRSLEKETLPWTRSHRSLGVVWLRRAVDLPPGADLTRLAITLGPVREVYELYANGVLIGSTGPFFDNSMAQVARSRTFPLPAEAMRGGSHLQLALRTRNPRLGSISLSINRGGFYGITYAEHAPADIGASDFDQQRVRHASKWVLSALQCFLAVLILALWFSETDRTDLIWLGTVAAMNCVLSGADFFQLFPDSFPLRVDLWHSLGEAVAVAALAELVSDSLGVPLRSFRFLLWPVCLLGAILRLDAWSAFLVNGIVLFALAYGWWRQRADQRRARNLTILILALSAINQMNSYGGDVIRLFPLTFRLGQFEISYQGIASLLLVVALAALALRRLMADRAEKQRLDGELESARIVQQLLLPQSRLATPAYALEAVYEPAQQVGGDFYWHRLDADGSFLVVVGDVSGKGLKAAMLVSVAIGILRAVTAQSPAAVLQAMNEGLAGHTGGGFVTACCARFSPDGEVTCANAGHPSPYADGDELAVSAGLPLGVVSGVVYEESILTGSSFTFVTDGVVEAESATRELFGFERTRDVSVKPAAEIAAAAKAWGQTDDITVVTVRRNG